MGKILLSLYPVHSIGFLFFCGAGVGWHLQLLNTSYEKALVLGIAWGIKGERDSVFILMELMGGPAEP